MRPMVLAGRLYVAVAPLYQLRRGKEICYAYFDRERDEILARWGGRREGVAIQRYKGLGEMNPEQLRETVFTLVEGTDNPVLNRHLLRVTVEDVPGTGHVMSTLMGADVAPRKKWLLRKWADSENGVEAEENGHDPTND
jgi:DNA gyrase/topoisomerase IV subunit B